ncbi:hypothetical protein K438DRAFT_1802109 [Mycena galopus ATCC 62051]|nr:hypothetical protein K438DRAFT_1802109 [Mycena galopus ATCC 62051]
MACSFSDVCDRCSPLLLTPADSRSSSRGRTYGCRALSSGRCGPGRASDSQPLHVAFQPLSCKGYGRQ